MKFEKPVTVEAEYIVFEYGDDSASFYLSKEDALKLYDDIKEEGFNGFVHIGTELINLKTVSRLSIETADVDNNETENYIGIF